jgi:hypothetical protein
MSRASLRLAAAATLLAFTAACASTTVIRSSPPGAKLYLDGSLVGQTPYAMTDTKIVGSTTHVQLKLDGHEDFNGVITRSEEFSAGAFLGGVLVLFPFLWIQGYKPERTYELTPLRYPPSAQPGYYYPPPPGYPPAGPPQPYAPQQQPAAAPPQYAPPPQQYAAPPQYAPPQQYAPPPQQYAPPQQYPPPPQQYAPPQQELQPAQQQLAPAATPAQ